MNVRFRSRALQDIAQVIDYIDEVSPASSPEILADIDRSIRFLKDYPHLGAPVRDLPLRRIVTRKYKFKIAYQLTAEAIIIVGIFRYQDRTS